MENSDDSFRIQHFMSGHYLRYDYKNIESQFEDSVIMNGLTDLLNSWVDRLFKFDSDNKCKLADFAVMTKLLGVDESKAGKIAKELEPFSLTPNLDQASYFRLQD